MIFPAEMIPPNKHNTVNMTRHVDNAEIKLVHWKSFMNRRLSAKVSRWLECLTHSIEQPHKSTAFHMNKMAKLCRHCIPYEQEGKALSPEPRAASRTAATCTFTLDLQLTKEQRFFARSPLEPHIGTDSIWSFAVKFPFWAAYSIVRGIVVRHPDSHQESSTIWHSETYSVVVGVCYDYADWEELGSARSRCTRTKWIYGIGVKGKEITPLVWINMTDV